MAIILSEISSREPKDAEKERIKRRTLKYLQKIEELQKKLYAEEKNALLVIFQGMDASGKDGAIKNIFSGLIPMGVHVHCFKKPTEEEFGHDFLWRVHHVVPRKGMVQIFNRSHYEDVLIQRVNKWIDEETVQNRFVHINNFEKLLEDTGTKVLKFYLHISKEAQLERLMERKTNPEKHWKHNPDDMKERELWDDYMMAYEDCFKNCSEHATWHIIPADKNWYKEYLVAKYVCEALEEMDPQFPKLEEDSNT